MTQLKFKKPCNECPWRRKSFPGWLGASDPESFVASQQELDMPCHKTVNYNDPDWELKLDEAASCVGGLQFLVNSMKMPHDPEIVKRRAEVGPNDEVFKWPHEFIEHHRQLGTGSWDYE